MTAERLGEPCRNFNILGVARIAGPATTAAVAPDGTLFFAIGTELYRLNA